MRAARDRPEIRVFPLSIASGAGTLARPGSSTSDHVEMRADRRVFQSITSDMQHHVDDRSGERELLQQQVDPATGLSRREIVVGGGLLLGSLFLAGCGGSKEASALPGPYWADPNADRAIVNALPPPVTVSPTPTPQPFRPAPPTIDDSPLPGIVSRSQWTRTGIARPRDINPMNGVRRITVHHDGMPPVTLATSSAVARRIEQIRNSHVIERGWADIGYHYIVDPQGRVWEGRSITKQGAHVKDQNENNLGILVLGNFDRQSPTQAALASLDKFVANQMQRYNIAISQVRTHMERDSTSCPGRSLQSYMLRTRSGSGTLYAMASRAGLARG